MAPVHAAASEGKVESLKHLHELGVDLLATDPNGWSAAHEASMDHGGASTMRVLHELGAAQTLLTTAQAKLEDAGCGCNVPVDEDDLTPAHVAAWHGSLQCMKVLHELFPNTPTVLSSRKNLQLIHCACMGGDAEIVEWLHEIGVPVNVCTLDGKTSVMLAQKYVQHCRRKLNVERAHITQNTVQYGEALVQQLMEWANQSSERAAELLLAEIEAESLAVSKQKRKAKKGKGRAMATKEPGGVSLVTNSAMMAGKASQSRTGVSGASGDEAGAPSGACSSTQGAPRTMLHLAADMHQSHDTKQMVKESFAMAICEEAQVDTSSVSTELDTNTSAREALQATAATGDVEALCSAIEEHLGVADSADLAEARAARNTLRKRKKREEKAQAKAAQARQALASADDISSLESALRITAGLYPPMSSQLLTTSWMR